MYVYTYIWSRVAQEERPRRVYAANELNFAGGTVVAPLSLKASTDCEFSFYRAALCKVIGLKAKEITAF